MDPCLRRDDAAYGAVAPRIFIDSNFKQGHLQPRLRDLAAGFARGLLKNVPPSKNSEGAGNAGRRCTRRWSNGPRDLPSKPRSLRRYWVARVARLALEGRRSSL